MVDAEKVKMMWQSFFRPKNQIHEVSKRLEDEKFYAIALQEVERGLRRDGLWAKALADCNMGKEAAAAKYIQLRVQSLKDEAQVSNAIQIENYLKQRIAEQKEKDKDKPRHTKCGGIIDRTQSGARVQWSCRKCSAKGAYTIGDKYK